MQTNQARWNTLRKLTGILALALLTTVATQVATADVYTDPVGFYKLTTQSNSDTVVSMPFARLSEATGLIGLISGNSITVSNSPGWTPGQWAYLGVALQSNHYYAVVSSGTKVGAIYPITNNTADTLAVELNPEDLSGVAAGNRLQIIPYWTLITAFPDGSVVPSASAGTRPSELLIPNYAGTGINQAPTPTYYFFTNATVRAWRQVAGGTTSRNNEILIPDGFAIVRQNTSTQTVVISLGAVPMTNQRTVIARNASGSGAIDNYIALFRPAGVTLNGSGLFQSGAFRPSASAGTRTDELLVPDNNAVGINKAPPTTYYYFTNATVSAWRQVAGGTTDRGTNVVFTPGFGVWLRVNDVGLPGSPTVATWVNTPPY